MTIILSQEPQKCSRLVSLTFDIPLQGQSDAGNVHAVIDLTEDEPPIQQLFKAPIFSAFWQVRAGQQSVPAGAPFPATDAIEASATEYTLSESASSESKLADAGKTDTWGSH